MDPEAQAIDQTWNVISRLPTDGQIRVIRYLEDRATMRGRGKESGEAENQTELPFSGVDRGEPDISDQLRVIFADREISKNANKILVTAAILQKRNRNRSLTAREISEPLKRAGVEISNIAAQLNAIRKRSGRAQLSVAAEKNRQNRYLVTAAGFKVVSALLGEPAAAESGQNAKLFSLRAR